MMKLTQSQYNELMYWAVQYYLLSNQPKAERTVYGPYKMYSERFRSIEHGPFGFFFSTESAKQTLYEAQQNPTHASKKDDLRQFIIQLNIELKDYFDLDDCEISSIIPRPNILTHTMCTHGASIALCALVMAAATGAMFIAPFPIGIALFIAVGVMAAAALGAEMGPFLAALSELPQDSELSLNFDPLVKS